MGRWKWLSVVGILLAGCSSSCPLGVVIVPGGQRVIAVGTETQIFIEGAQRGEEFDPESLEMIDVASEARLMIDESQPTWNLCGRQDPSATVTPVGRVDVDESTRIRVTYKPAGVGPNTRIIFRNVQWHE